ncbi:hypothetical protein SAMN06297251_10645 [Fulvimarina manganoxydans]|uniref:Uncharacterized protein n=1 Tax=Fulvimarina manganoxydans TaxID=937218 RepID=A0A1W2BC86_9HYPH|nr:hypothetical protein [Fulvimarina manganoxydans]SMC70519.1 hypothetical protein SAMN06297251_10645 [Fulvimarina manganoxydans]
MSKNPTDTFDATAAFAGLETLISRTAKFADLVSYLVAVELEDPVEDDRGKHFVVWEATGEHLVFLAEEARLCAAELEAQWIASHNARCRVERGEA